MAQLKLAVVSDMHYYSRTLGDTGSAYEARSGSDMKCLAETGGICDAAFDIIAKSGCDAVLMVGDLTNNGEKASHTEFELKLRKLAESIPVYVVYATHDWCCDGNAASYDGDMKLYGVETLTPAQLRELYAPYGANGALSEYVCENGSSSYCALIKPGFRLLGLNDDTNGHGKGGFSEEHLLWIERMIREAKEAGDEIIAMEHHLIMAPFARLINKSMMLGDADDVVRAYAGAGLEFVFTGHSHMQRVTEKDGVYQINIGSLTGWPAPITYFTLDREKAEMHVEYLESFEFDGVVRSSEYIRDHTLHIFTGIVDALSKGGPELKKTLAASGVNLGSVPVPAFILKGAAKMITGMKVGSAARLINCLTFGKGVDKKAARAIADDSLYERIKELFLNLWSGTPVAYGDEEPFSKVVRSVASLPRRVVKALPVKKLHGDGIMNALSDIEKTAALLVKPNFDAKDLVIYRNKK